jgi:hypothetical protein
MISKKITPIQHKKNHLLDGVMVSFLMLTIVSTKGQTVEIDWVQISGKEVVVHYNLEDENPIHAYTINLFSSGDNFASPLLKLSGDYGNEVKAGKDRQIRWQIIEELGQYAGPIELEIRAKMYVPFMKMTEFGSKKKYRRGKNYPLVWRSGNPGGHMDIELYLSNTRVHSDRNVANTGKFDWQIPTTAKPSGEYRLKFTNTKNREEVHYTQPFRVVSKIPRVAKFVAGAAIVAVGVILFSNRDTKGNPNLPELTNADTPSNGN